MTERMIEGLSDETQKLLQTYVTDVKGVFGEQLEGMLLYGSAVRGEFLPGRSNLNILLLVSSYDSRSGGGPVPPCRFSGTNTLFGFGQPSGELCGEALQ